MSSLHCLENAFPSLQTSPFPHFFLKNSNKSFLLPQNPTAMAFQKIFLFFLLFSFALCSRVDSEPTQDKQALLSFLSQTRHATRVQWNSSESACNWVGVECDSNRSFVSSLRLPGAGLVGQIPAGTLGRLTQLRALSLRNNRLSGQLPADFSNLKFLRSVFLQKNLFSGEFPAILTALPSLVRLDLSDNRFSGEIPPSLANLTSLTGLLLNDNGFSGNLPTADFPSLRDFNVSNNNLSGPIPKSLERFGAASFAGNGNLCGRPLVPCVRSSESPAASSPQTPSGKSSKKLSRTAIIAIAAGGAVVLLLALILLLCCCCRTSRSPPKKTPAARSVSGAVQDVGNSSAKEEAGGRGEDIERKKLVFLDGGVYGFDLEDLLRASAEVLGKGSVGTSYKAAMEEGTTVVVKRLKDVAVSQKEFEQQMGVLGKMKHMNLVPLKAFYYSKDEKLLISEFMEAGSLSALLHGGRGSGRALLNWDQRLKIALAAGRSLLHLHLSGGIVHGNIKSSNVLLSADLDACVSDYGLHPLFGTSAPPIRIAGYRAPEVIETRNPTMKSDVYSYGVLLLELLTGKPPNQAAVVGEDGIDLPRWVQSVVREEWMSVVFDVELVKYGSLEEEMVQLLQIAMNCVSTYPDQRPTMEDVIARIEDIEKKLRAIDTQSSDEPSKAPSGSRTPSP